MHTFNALLGLGAHIKQKLCASSEEWVSGGSKKKNTDEGNGLY